ncbi:MAG: adenosylmethionine decarboxylase [Thermodesulfobacteriota bacterium]|nr:adenosylmethionine decarboxylase [Thermodesulfobacteriota bacterium]
MTRIVEAFGPHLILDGFGCNAAALVDKEGVRRFLDRTPDLIGMTKIMPPFVFRFPRTGGLSGIVIIAESHISVHTWPEKGSLQLDIFSCKQFDVRQAINEAVRQFGIKEYDRQVLDRGLEFPRSLAFDYLISERVKK